MCGIGKIVGQKIYSVWLTVFVNVVNIGLNALFLYVLKFDNPIIAVAISSVISRVLAVIVLLILCCIDSEKEENKYGPSPKYVEKEII